VTRFGNPALTIFSAWPARPRFAADGHVVVRATDRRRAAGAEDDQFWGLAAVAALPLAWLESEPAWSMAALK